MPKEQTIIDYEIIWKKINRTISVDEEFLLAKWLQESPAHEVYLAKAMHYYKEGSDFNQNREETERAWRKLKKKVLKRNRTVWGPVISVSAAVIVILVIITLFLPTHKPGNNPTAFANEVITPGSNKATLILDDGSVYDLSSSKKLVLSEGGSEIKSEGDKLQYSETNGPVKELKYNTLSIPRGGEFFLKLADGTKVWLNSETVLRYPIQFGANERRVELTGEAFFEVTRNEKVPFIVESGEQTVKVLGTEFNISSYKDNQLIYTTLIKGSVEVCAKNKPENREILIPNEQSSINKIRGEITKRMVDPYQYVAWKDGRFVFDDQTLGEIMKILSKWYNVEVTFEHEDLKNIRFTGNLKRYSDFGDLMKKIQKTDEVAITIKNNQITIK